MARILPQRLVFPDLQNLHSLHSGVLQDVRGLKRAKEEEDTLECDHVVAGLYVGNALADRLDDTSALMTEDDREGTFGVLAGECVCIC